VPAIAYLGTLTFLQLTLGYIIGRTVVAYVLLPRYFAGQLSTAYGLLGERFGDGTRALVSVTFLITRLLADGVRLFATAIPVKIIAEAAGLDVGYFVIIASIGVVTILYTYIGGIRAVVWMDVIQMTIYVGGALFALGLLFHLVDPAWAELATAAGKLQVLDFRISEGVSAVLTAPYAFATAVIGGAVLSMASHGTDQLTVQRLLACRTLRDSQKALITSGFIVAFQFALFLLVGTLLWAYYGGASLAELHLSRGDEVFPRFIIEAMPPGIAGLLIAGIIAAAMSTLSSSLNSLASSTMIDLYERIRPSSSESGPSLAISRGLTLGWGILFIVFATLFEDQQNPVVELGLAIASFTYGGMLGVFVLGLASRRAAQLDATLGFVVAIGGMVLVILGLWYHPEQGWLFLFNPSDSTITELGLRSVGWPWYTAIGTLLTFLVGSLTSLRHT
jgi:SSS family transporter